MFQRNELEQKLIEKALKDEAFRKQLLENPKNAIETETGMKIPEYMKIKIVEEDPQTVYLVLPFVSAGETQVELSEIELQEVAGGTGPLSENNACYQTIFLNDPVCSPPPR